jgi:alkylation response protein AidB-like acyl-CoA dehydrogenase
LNNLPKGGDFLLEQTDPGSIFTVEDFSQEHHMIYRTAIGFVNDKVLPVMNDLEAKKEGLNKELLLASGELGLLGADVPEEYGGYDLDKVSSCIIAECIGKGGSFIQTHGGQTSIGIVPLVFFGTHEQKLQYLPEFVTGELVTAYALTEPGAGSDALSAKTKAVLSEDGKHYVLNGAKQFITNAGIADVFITFAKIDGDKFTAFIVDAHAEGVSTSPEEHKMGIKGSSTRSVYFDDVKVPLENVLGEIGKGHLVAFNALNNGRFKMAANTIGFAKYALDVSVEYANERRQFNQPIAEFGLIKEKLADMAAKIYAMESTVYRTAGLLENKVHSMDVSGPDGGRVVAACFDEYAVECSLNKVFTTEGLGQVTDEGVQIHGGYGYISEYPIERLYRDSRVYRIFEGTNEINRTVITNTLIRRGLSGQIPLKEAIANLQAQMAAGISFRNDAGDLVQACKDIALFTLGALLEKYGKKIAQHEEIVGKLADIIMSAFVMESALLRARKALARDGKDSAQLKINMADIFIYSNIDHVFNRAKEIMAAIADGERLAELYSDLGTLLQYTPQNTIALRQEVAGAISSANKYVS